MTFRIALSRTVARLPRSMAAFRPVATPLVLNRGYSEGDTGGVRYGGDAAGDSFTRREKAQEDFYIKQRERERLSKLREKLAAQRKHLDDLEEDIKELEKEAGGEHN
ncbi:hypothetical protein DRE_05154 [Drechslerella stenobrocha 248]|uniref:ATPase inhibitor, mitochondrial n=1 Tax=Drechslerella stenobrocha 248 TaxID=1043628 RepID=W7I006_9PEZI|nr:hypothetical protein DRE_05154 [Drechslerella stenobrocha 248]